MTTGSIRRAGGAQRIPAPHSRHDAGKPLWDNRSVEFSLDSLISTVADRAEPLGAISSRDLMSGSPQCWRYWRLVLTVLKCCSLAVHRHSTITVER